MHLGELKDYADMLLTCGIPVPTRLGTSTTCAYAKENPGFFLMTADVRVWPLLAG